MQALGEAGVRGFSRPGVESSSLYDNTVGAVFPQPAEFFIIPYLEQKVALHNYEEIAADKDVRSRLWSRRSKQGTIYGERW